MPKQQQISKQIIDIIVAGATGDGGNPYPPYPGTPAECVQKRCECGSCTCVTTEVSAKVKCQATWGNPLNQKELDACYARAERAAKRCQDQCKATCNKGFDPYPQTQS